MVHQKQKRFFVDAKTLPDSWFQLVYGILEHGREFKIDEGSFAGHTRLEFDWVDIHVERPFLRDSDGLPLVPEMPEASDIPAPTDKGRIANYAATYIMGSDVAENESYTYASRMNHVKISDEESDEFLHRKDIYKGHLGNPQFEGIVFDSEKYLSQIETVIWTYKNRGHRNNQMCIQIADPKDIMLKDPPCVHGDTKILTKNGYKKAKEVRKGEYVLTHKRNWKKITKTYKRLYNGKLRKIKMKGIDNELLITPEHPIYVKKVDQCPYDSRLTCKEICKKQYSSYEKHGKKCKKLYNNYSDNWIESKNLTKNCFIKIPVLKEEKLELASKNTFWLYGLWLAEGDYAKGGIRFNLGNHEKGNKAKDKLIEISNGTIGFSHGKIEETDNTIRIPFYSTGLERNFKELFGSGALNKKIPFDFLRQESYKLRSLLDGYLLGDGYYRERGEHKQNSLSTSSENLKDSFILILLKLGYIPSVSKNYPKSSEIDGRKIKANSFNYVISWTEEKKKNSKSYIENLEYFFNPVILNDETEIDVNCDVYNFEVEDDNSYIAENFTVHNCLRTVDTRIQDDYLHFYIYFRSWDLWSGYPENLAGLSILHEYMASEIGVLQGEFICTSKGLHLYDFSVDFAKMRCLKE